MFLIIWLILILIFSVIPVSGPQIDLPTDKIVHGILYGVTAIFFFRYLISRTSKIRAIYLSIIIASAYGVSMEFIQYFMPHRSFSFGDIMANTSGAFVFCIIYASRRR